MEQLNTVVFVTDDNLDVIEKCDLFTKEQKPVV